VVFNTDHVISLLIGFTFFKAKDTIQGTQNKLFVRFIPQVLMLYC
jgi:ABC-type multidrug transport system permease subunit